MRIIKFVLLSVLSVILLALYSCNNKAIREQAERQQFVADSLRTDSLRRDSICIDSLSLIAFRDAKFGMTKEELKDTEVFKNAKSYFDDLIEGSCKLYYEYFAIEGILKDNKLVEIQIYTNYMTANYIKSYLKDCADVLYQNLKSEVNNFKTYISNPSVLDTGLIYGSIIGDKYIFISLEEKESGSQYRVKCTIANNKFNRY